MATKPPVKSVDITRNVAKVDASRAASSVLPGDMITDLTDAFDFYEKQQGVGVVSIDHFINILKNFGFHKMDKKSTDQELMKANSEFHKCTGVDFNFCKYVVSRRWNAGNGMQEEAVECFKLFNKRNHDTITA